MKYLLTPIIVMLSLAALYASDIPVKPQTKDVLVYLQNARITAVAEFNLTTGNHTIILQKLPQQLDENSIQLKGDADFTIMSISCTKNYLAESEKDSKLKALEDSIENIGSKLSGIKNQLDALAEELAMIRANQSIGGANTGVSALELEKIANFYRSRNLEIHNRKSEAEKKQQKWQERLTLINNQLTQMRNKQTNVFTEIVIAVNSNHNGKVKLDINYLVREAGWSPLYDIKSNGQGQALQIMAKANVFQHTGEDWKNVKLALSTGNPTNSNTKPQLMPHYLSLSIPGQLYRKNYSRSKSAAPVMFMDAQPAAVREEKTNHGVSLSTSDFTSNNETQTNNIFEIAVPSNIPCDGQEYVVAIQSYQVNAGYSYSAIPKLDKDAFLLANLVNWDQTGLLPGDANLFNEGTFIGKSYFETRQTGDTIPISMGREKNVIIERKKTKMLTEKNFSGSTKTTTMEYEINIRNKKKEAIEIHLEDQIPLSNNAEVSVELTGSSGAVYEKETGKLSWKITLKPSENQSIRFSYEVKYPKKYNISNLE